MGRTSNIEHYTSHDLINWDHQSSVPGQPSEGIIDPCIFRLEDGTYGMWFKAEGSQTYVSFSDDLYHWGPSKNINISGGKEAPNVFFWKGKYRMILDYNQRLTLFSSDDGKTWPMSSQTDIGGQHGDVVNQDGEAILVYFAENYNLPGGKGNKTALYLNKLAEKSDGTIWCDHEAVYEYNLHAPEIRKMEVETKPSKLTYVVGQELDLSGLELSVHFADSLHDTLTADDFEEYSITSSIAPGSKLGKGDTEIKLSTEYGGSVTIPITAKEEGSAEPVRSISLNKNALSLLAGAKETLTATVLPSDASDKNVLWSTSNGAVATVNNGQVTAVSEGTAVITAMLASDKTIKAECTVTVSKAAPDEPTKEPPKDKLKRGDTFITGSLKYKITKMPTSKADGTVQVVAIANKKVKTISVPSAVKHKEFRFKVTSMASNVFKNNIRVTAITIGNGIAKIPTKAFSGDKKLKSITIRSKKLKKVGSKAFYKIHSKAKIKVPAKNLKKYRRILNKKGQKSSVKIVK